MQCRGGALKYYQIASNQSTSLYSSKYDHHRFKKLNTRYGKYIIFREYILLKN